MLGALALRCRMSDLSIDDFRRGMSLRFELSTLLIELPLLVLLPSSLAGMTVCIKAGCC